MPKISEEQKRFELTQEIVEKGIRRVDAHSVARILRGRVTLENVRENIRLDRLLVRGNGTWEDNFLDVRGLKRISVERLLKIINHNNPRPVARRELIDCYLELKKCEKKV